MDFYDSSSRDADGEDFDYSGVDDQDSNDSSFFCPRVNETNLELQRMEASNLGPQIMEASHSVPPILEASHSVPPILEASHSVPPILEASGSVPPVLEDSASEPQSLVDSNFDYQSADTQDSGIQTISSEDLDFQPINNQDSDVQIICSQGYDNQSLDGGEVNLEFVRMREDTFHLLRKTLFYFLQHYGYQWKTEFRSPELCETLVNDVGDGVIILGEILRPPFKKELDATDLNELFSDERRLEDYLVTFGDALFVRRLTWSGFCAFIVFIGELCLRCRYREDADRVICALENAARKCLKREMIEQILALGKFPNLLQFLRRKILIHKGRDDLHTLWDAYCAANPQ